jgi:hypothetical protein
VPAADVNAAALPLLEDVVFESKANTLLEAPAESEFDADTDASALLRDALERNDDVLLIVEFEAELKIEERDAGSALDSALLGNTLVDVGDGVTGVLLT